MNVIRPSVTFSDGISKTLSITITVTIVVASSIHEFTIDWGRLAGSGLLSALPVLILSLYVQKYMLKGIAFGGLKA